MAMFACFSPLLVVKKKKSKRSSKCANGCKKGSSNDDLRVEPIDLLSTSSPEINGLKEHYLTATTSFPSVEKSSSNIPKVLSDDSLARAEFAGEVAYEGGVEHDAIRSMKREYSDLNSYVLEKTETDEAAAAKALIVSGHVSDPGMERKASLESPVLKRSCSNIEIKQAKRWVTSPKRPSYLQNLSGNGGVEISYETSSSPLSVRTSCSADRVMLKRRSSSQVLPSRSRKIWWKLFLWSHRNLHKPRSAPERLVSVHNALNQKDGYSSDTHEAGQEHDNEKKESIEPENHNWVVAFSLESSHMDRVNTWVNNLEDCSFSINDVEEHYDEIEDDKTSDPHHLEIGESDKNCSYHVAEEVSHANNIIPSLNSFSSVAHISGIGLKVIPPISSFVCLRSVNLSGNCIVHITPGSLPKSLHTLDLSRNKISNIEGLRELERLRVLNVSYNRITRIGHGLSSCTLIKELYLAGNKISNIEGLHRLLKLTVLDLSFNKITTGKALGQLVANYNSLLALNLLGNPIVANIGDDQLKKAVLSLLPHVTYLNKQPIKPLKVREVVTKSITKAALGDSAWSTRRKLTKRSSQVSGSSSTKSGVGKGSFRAVKHGKSRHSTSGKK